MYGVFMFTYVKDFARASEVLSHSHRGAEVWKWSLGGYMSGLAV